MSRREVAMNANWRHGDMLCPSCNTAGRHDLLRPARCSACGKATCFVCRGAEDDQKEPHAYARCCSAMRMEASA